MRKDICNGYEAVNVTLNSFTKNIGKLIWDAYKMTWNDLQDIDYDPKNETVRKACFDVIRNKALPTPKESIEFNFRIDNLSRVCLAQITRGRVGWWYNVESQMPRPLVHGVTIPKNIYLHPTLGPKAIGITKQTQNFYDECHDAGIPPQDCRYMSVHGQQTSMVANCNYVALSSFFTMRAENGLTDELNLIARMMKKEIRNNVENYAKHIGHTPAGWNSVTHYEIDELSYELWQELISNLDCLGAKQKKCMIVDKVFGNTGRYPSANGEVASPDGMIKPDYDFKKSAWYLELLEMDENLLLPDEKEMIAKWKVEKS